MKSILYYPSKFRTSSWKALSQRFRSGGDNSESFRHTYHRRHKPVCAFICSHLTQIGYRIQGSSSHLVSSRKYVSILHHPGCPVSEALSGRSLVAVTLHGVFKPTKMTRNSAGLPLLQLDEPLLKFRLRYPYNVASLAYTCAFRLNDGSGY